MTGPSPLWYTTRASGVVALVLLTGTVALGIAGVNRFATPRWPRLLTSGLHRNLSLLAVGFLALHILTAELDTFAPVGWVSLLVPFSSAYRPLWLGLGTTAFDLVLALVVTSLLRGRLRYPAWRAVHWAAYAAWPLALWHGLGTGTDGRLPWLLAIDACCLLAVIAAVWWRLALTGHPGRPLAAAGTLLVPLATVLFAVAGPLQPGWARRAGTPAALLSHGGTAAAATAGAGTGHAAGPASAAFTGQITQSGGEESGPATVTVTARTQQPQQSIVITLQGTAGDNGGIALSSGQVKVVPGGAAASYAGPVTSLNGSVVGAVVSGPGGYRARLRITLAISGGTVTGRMTVTPGGSQ